MHKYIKYNSQQYIVKNLTTTAKVEDDDLIVRDDVIITNHTASKYETP